MLEPIGPWSVAVRSDASGLTMQQLYRHIQDSLAPSLCEGRSSGIQQLWHPEWKQALAGSICNKITQFCVPFGGLAEPIGRSVPASFLQPVGVNFGCPDVPLRLAFWGSFWVPKMNPILGTGTGRLLNNIKEGPILGTDFGYQK